MEDPCKPAVDEIPIFNLFTNNSCLAKRSPPLLENLKGISGKGISPDSKIRWRSFYIYQHFRIIYVYTTFLACNTTSQQLLIGNSMRKSWSHVFCQYRVMTALMIIESQKYILENIHILRELQTGNFINNTEIPMNLLLQNCVDNWYLLNRI